MRAPLLPPLAALAAGVLAARYTGPDPRALLAAITALLLLALAAYWKGTRRTALAACLTAVFFAGALAGVAHRPGAPPELDAAAREIVILSGCVVEPAVLSPEREQFTLELEPGARVRVSFYLRPGERPPDLRYGQRAEVEARVRIIRNFRNPGAFDNAGYQARRHVYWTAAVVRGTPVRVLPGKCGSSFWNGIYRLRVAALDRLERLYRGNAYRTAMTQAVLVGESSGLEKVWTEDYRRTGTYHALVISGLHITVLAAFLLFLMRLCSVPETAALAATALAGWLYALVSGWQAPVVRAAAGFMLYVVGRWMFRRARLLNLLAAVAIGFLIFDPEQMFEASFQLSFLAVLAIGALAVPLLERTSGPLARGLRALGDASRDLHLEPRIAAFRLELRLLAETLSLWTRLPLRACLAALGFSLRLFFFAYQTLITSATVQFGLALPMAVYFHRLSITGLSANVLIVPLLSAVVPVGFVAIFTGWKWVGAVAGWLLDWSQQVAAWHVQWEPAWRIPDPPLWLALAFTAALLALALFRWKAGWLMAAAALLALVVWHPFPPHVERRSLELTAIDVGQGESLFLAFPDARLMVLDGGGIPAYGLRRPARLDIGEDVVSPYLWTRSIRRLDVVAMSHAHEDHCGGLPALIANFHPRELWTGLAAEGPEWARVREAALRYGVRIVPLRAGRSFSYGGAQVEVLAPSREREPASLAANNDSLVLRLRYGRHSFLLTGDIERQVEWELLDRGLARAQVLKVAHHGSRTSTTAPFLDVVRPAFALISAGAGNPFGNPHPQVVQALERSGALVLRTDLSGLVSIHSDGRRFSIDAPYGRSRLP